MANSRGYSLRRRLLASASVLLLLFLGAMGGALHQAFTKSVLATAESALRNQVLLLMANIEMEQQQITAPQALSEPRLTQTDASLFAQIVIPERGVLWRSPSLLGRNLSISEGDLGIFKFEPDMPDLDGMPVYGLSFAAAWEAESGDVPFVIQVAEHRQPYLERLRAYREQLVLWLTVLGMSLLLLLLGLLNWGLKPLARVTRQVSEIEQGERQRFSEDYPLEVSRLTQNLNQLLNFEQQRIDRQQETLGNLAHSLKTPLAVMHGIDYSEQNKAEARKQLGAMQQIIDYQLQSASAVGRRRFARPVEVAEPTQKVIDSLQKLYQEKAIKVDFKVEPNTQFFGDVGDWLDLVGNLLENAFKWSESEVSVSLRNCPVVGVSESHRLATQITVSDNGSGIEGDLKQIILQRGVRLDSQTPGHGLGMHIVKGIVEAYEGRIEISDNVPTGAVFKVVLN